MLVVVVLVCYLFVLLSSILLCRKAVHVIFLWKKKPLWLLQSLINVSTAACISDETSKQKAETSARQYNGKYNDLDWKRSIVIGPWPNRFILKWGIEQNALLFKLKWRRVQICSRVENQLWLNPILLIWKAKRKQNKNNDLSFIRWMSHHYNIP